MKAAPFASDDAREKDWSDVDPVIERLWFMFNSSVIERVTGLHKTQVYRRVAALGLPLRGSPEFKSAVLRMAREVGHLPNAGTRVVPSLTASLPKLGGAGLTAGASAFLGRDANAS